MFSNCCNLFLFSCFCVYCVELLPCCVRNTEPLCLECVLSMMCLLFMERWSAGEREGRVEYVLLGGLILFYCLFIRHFCRSIKDRHLTVSELRPLIIRCVLLVLTTAGLLLFRVSLLHGHLPHFSAQDNPASFSESLVTRVLTYFYLLFFNARSVLTWRYSSVIEWRSRLIFQHA